MKKSFSIVLAAIVFGFAANAQMVGSTNTASVRTSGSSSYLDHGWETSLVFMGTPLGYAKHGILGGDIHFGYEWVDGLYIGGQVSMEWLYLQYQSIDKTPEGYYYHSYTSDFSVPVFGVVRKYFQKAYRVQPYLNGGLGILRDKTYLGYIYDTYNGSLSRTCLFLQAGGGIRARMSPHFSAFLETDMDVISGGRLYARTSFGTMRLKPVYKATPVLKLGITYHLDNPPFWRRML